MSPREKLWDAIGRYLRVSVAATRDDAVGEECVRAVERAAEEVDRAVDAMPVVRHRLPKCRRSRRCEFRVRGEGGSVKLFVEVGFYPDGRVGEVFLDTSKEGSDLRHFMQGFAVALSLLLQVGMPIAVIENAFSKKLSGGPRGAVDGPEELGITHAHSMIDLVAQVLKAVEVQRAGGT